MKFELPSWLGVNKWTNLLGTAGLAGSLALVFSGLSTEPIDWEKVASGIVGVLTALGVIKAKDANVTGGTVGATSEAKVRVNGGSNG